MSIPRILAIAPNEGVAQVIQEVCRSRSDVSVILRIGDLENGLLLMQAEDRHSYDMILSRGGTARLLALHSRKPVVEIRSGLPDLLRAIRLVYTYHQNFAIIGFKNMTVGIETIIDMISPTIRVITIQKAEEVSPALLALKEEGITCVIGDTVTVRYANAMQMNGILISSGSESISNAIDECVTLFAHLERSRHETQKLRQVLDMNKIRCAFLNSKGEILMAWRTKDIPELEKKLPVLRDQIALRGGGMLLKRYGSATYTVQSETARYLEEEGTLLSLKKMDGPWNDEAVSDPYMEANQQPDAFYDAIGQMQRLLPQIEAAAHTHSPLVIYAEEGISLSAIKRSISLASSFHTQPMLCIDLRVMTEERVRRLLERDDSPLLENNMTVFMEHADSLNESQQRQLIQYMEDTALAKRTKLVITLQPREAPCLVALYLSEHYSPFVFHIPSYRDRPEDLPFLISQLTSQCNEMLGKEVAGYSSDAMKELVQYPWRENALQLQRVIRQVVIKSTSPMITLGEVEAALKAENNISRPNAYALQLEGTLDEISSQIVLQVLREEKMSKSKAAARLNISRTTLWRILSRMKDALDDQISSEN